MTTIPVLGMTNTENSFPDGLAYQLEADMYIPTVYHVGPDMTVVGADTGDTDPARYL